MVKNKDNEIELVIGTRNKKGLIKKIKWYPEKILINKEQYEEYLELKEKFERVRMVEE
jgi:hypothetical protein